MVVGIERLRPGFVAALALVPLALAALAPAQGPVYRERWGHLHLEQRRSELLVTVPASDEQALTAVGAALARTGSGAPFRDVATAFAMLAQRPLDDGFLLRTTLSAFVLPEVVDPTADVEACRSLHVSLFLPFTVPLPAAVSFELEVLAEARESGDQRVFATHFTPEVTLADLRAGRISCEIPARDFDDGSYVLLVRTLIDGAAPAADEPRLRWRFHVQRGYQQRAATAMQEAAEAQPRLEPLAAALLHGFGSQVARAYAGEAFAVESDAVRQLQHLERAVANVAAERLPIAGMRGDVVTALPDGNGGALGCVLLDLDPEPVAADGRTLEPRPQRPLIVCAGGAPAYDLSGYRPTAPAVREAAWVANDVRALLHDDVRVVCLDSPGGGRDYAQALTAALDACERLLPTGDVKPFLVCEREAAAIVALRIQEFAARTSGVVLVGGGAMPPTALQRDLGVPVRVVPLHGHPGTRAARSAIEFAALRRRNGDPTLDLALLQERELPWPFGVVLAIDAIDTLARERLQLPPRPR